MVTEFTIDYGLVKCACFIAEIQIAQQVLSTTSNTRLVIWVCRLYFMIEQGKVASSAQSRALNLLVLTIEPLLTVRPDFSCNLFHQLLQNVGVDLNLLLWLLISSGKSSS